MVRNEIAWVIQDSYERDGVMTHLNMQQRALLSPGISLEVAAVDYCRLENIENRFSNSEKTLGDAAHGGISYCIGIWTVVSHQTRDIERQTVTDVNPLVRRTPANTVERSTASIV